MSNTIKSSELLHAIVKGQPQFPRPCCHPPSGTSLVLSAWSYLPAAPRPHAQQHYPWRRHRHRPPPLPQPPPPMPGRGLRLPTVSFLIASEPTQQAERAATTKKAKSHRQVGLKYPDRYPDPDPDLIWADCRSFPPFSVVAPLPKPPLRPAVSVITSGNREASTSAAPSVQLMSPPSA